MIGSERGNTDFPPGSETAWIAKKERTKAALRLEFEAWLHRVLVKPTEGELRVETSLDQLNERLLNQLLRFQDFREAWLKAREKPENPTNK